MTEKRFTLIKNTGTDECDLNNLYDNKTFIGSISIGAEMICYLLNTLHKKNQQLKQELWETRKDYIIETADISDKPRLQEILKQEHNEIYQEK